MAWSNHRTERMTRERSDTIFALSSGGLPSGVAVIRISGAGCREALTGLTGSVPRARTAALRSIHNRNDLLLDRALVLFFAGPHSFTGEDCAELQVHGGRASVKAVLDALGSFDGFREAEAGEFTRRAFHNGKLDLVEVEGLADLLAAETEMQRRLAVEHATGALSALYGVWARRLVHARAMIEAELDFADEEDIPGSVSDTIWTDLAQLTTEIDAHVVAGTVGEVIRDGLRIVVAGAPNSGKSSLINYLSGRDIAIVTDIPGTTRDLISVDLDLAGYLVRLTDTAGLRETEEPVEREGIRRARTAIAEADLVIELSDDWSGPTLSTGPGRETLRVFSKADGGVQGGRPDWADLAISVHTGYGMEDLLAALRVRLPAAADGHAMALPTRRRHMACLADVVREIGAADVVRRQGLDLAAEHLRRATDALGRLTGRVDVEDLLDVIFSEFCIGK
ncbi:tRNA uridine-5-carboxymethylaminomethyl(34) synthesis GTPase MnmE [Rhizobium sp. TRM95111]|uniref:tRNA uridine-5-carboxymethylaminomethyl(34) synthesis GTPase MnmE n=1 Tax=Rhizobium alarense TaxID=2846851 RepID=UPI001F1D079E|nr:tRNA uridine-5-carboxymethylaminomethyl(34) synthesis GTPase MnmE [Rhizobium alarense]MCF3639971.1 tRNA uridine-5-carboxymethylaminomethyl(34) synthesis GTPase MnmE [Rhizobium alarense]